MKTTHTHRGTCQACGRIHAVDNTSKLVAKHGYKVTFGYFHGVCPGGRGYKPAEFDVSLTHKVIVDCTEQAKEQDQLAAALRNGITVPETFDRWNAAKIIQKKNPWVLRYDARGGYDTLPIAEATPDERKRAIDGAIYKHESTAKGLREHAKALVALVLPRFGQSLFDANEVKPEPVQAVVDIKAAKVTGSFATKQARKDALTKISREFEIQKRALHDLCLDVPHAERTAAQDEVYWGPSELHNWRPRHSAQALKVFPQSKDIIARIEELYKAREAVKAAP